MKTEIFKDYSDFLNREDKKINGVSDEFAKESPNYLADNETNEGCWNCISCRSCHYCRSCRYCHYCSDCSDCSSCSGEENKKDGGSDFRKLMETKIENIHNKVLDAINGGSLDMSDCHKSSEGNSEGAYCGTTHCRAGWVIALAGKDGVDLEKQTDTCFAAMQIYKNSSEIKVSPTRFFEPNEVAMADIIRCAKEEEQNKN